jgi:hypothetical protein
MLIFSPLLRPFLNITTFIYQSLHKSSSQHPSYFPMPALIHLPESSQIFHGCILIYMRFYCQFRSYIPTSLPSIIPTSHKYCQKKKFISMLQFFIILFICVNFHTVYAIYTDTISITSLSVLPICLAAGFALKLATHPRTLPSSPLPMPNPPQAISTENDKLAYISIWTYLHDNNKLRFMIFRPVDNPYV